MGIIKNEELLCRLQKSMSEVSPEERERGKRVVYAALYGAGTRKLMEILHLTYDRTLDVLSSFNSQSFTYSPYL